MEYLVLNSTKRHLNINFEYFIPSKKLHFSNYRFTKPFTSFIAISFLSEVFNRPYFYVRKGWSLLKLISLCWNFARFTRPVHGKGPTWPCYVKIVIIKTMLCIDLIHYMYVMQISMTATIISLSDLHKIWGKILS